MGLNKTKYFVSGSVIALMLASSAIAQTPTEPPVAAEAQQDPATTDATTDIVVTGVRASLERAQEVKRQAPSVVEAITAEDIGKFTDSSLADALQRVPGVAISRNYRGQDQGDGINIRGLGRDYVQTTVNGRELLGNPEFFGGSGRNFDFGAIPPDILGSILIYKSPTANIVEAGLAGEVDLRTIRPLDVKTREGRSYFGSLTAAAFIDPKGDKYSPQFNGVIGGKFLDGTLGVYLAGVYSREKTEAEQQYNYTGVFTLNFLNANGTNTIVPNAVGPSGFGYRLQEQNLKRNSIAAGLQYEPDDRLSINADFLYYKYTIAIQQRNSDYIGPGFVGKFSPTAVIQPGGVVLNGSDIVYFDTSRITGGGTPYQRAGLLNVSSPTEAYNGGLNVAWKNDSGFKIAGDAAYGKTTFFQFWRGFYGTNDLSGGSQSTYDIRDRDRPLLTFSGPAASNISNPASYSFSQGLFSFQSFARNERKSAQLDLEQQVSDGLTLKAGARYSRTTSNFINLIGLMNAPALNTTGFFNGSDTPPGYPVSVPRADLNAICGNNPVYCNSDNRGRGSFTGNFPTTTAGKPGDLYSFDPSNSYFIRESKLAFYGQADFKADLGGASLQGNLGLRAVRIRTLGQGFQGVQFRVGNVNGLPTPGQPSVTRLVTDEGSYWSYLPTLNVTLKPSDNINLRFSVAKTVSPAQYSVLAPRGTATVVTPDATGGAQRSVFNGGNTQLKPTSAWNYDVTAEYYTPTGGAFVLSLFYKDVKDLIQTTSVVGTVPGQGTRLFDITAAQNAQKGRVYGFEVGVNQPLTFLPGALSGLGVQANYAYVNTETELTGIGKVPFLGNSRHNVNTSLYYDGSGFTGRLAFFYRSKEYQQAYIPGNNRFVDPQYSLDFSLSKRVFDNLELRLNVVNLTGRDVFEKNSSSGALANYYERPRTILLGARVTM